MANAIWLLLLTLLAAGLASGHQTAHAIAQWVKLQATALRTVLPELTRLPSEATLLRTLRLIDVAGLEQAVAQLTRPKTPAESAARHITTPCGTMLQAQAVDGKVVRGASACGAPTHLVSLVQHGSGVTLAQIDEIAIVANLDKPLAILHGEHEQLVNSSYFATLTMPTLWQGAVQIVPGAGHAPHWEQAERFNALIDAFVQDSLRS